MNIQGRIIDGQLTFNEVKKDDKLRFFPLNRENKCCFWNYNSLLFLLQFQQIVVRLLAKNQRCYF